MDDGYDMDHEGVDDDGGGRDTAVRTDDDCSDVPSTQRWALGHDMSDGDDDAGERDRHGDADDRDDACDDDARDDDARDDDAAGRTEDEGRCDDGGGGADGASDDDGCDSLSAVTTDSADGSSSGSAGADLARDPVSHPVPDTSAGAPTGSAAAVGPTMPVVPLDLTAIAGQAASPFAGVPGVSGETANVLGSVNSLMSDAWTIAEDPPRPDHPRGRRRDDACPRGRRRRREPRGCAARAGCPRRGGRPRAVLAGQGGAVPRRVHRLAGGGDPGERRGDLRRLSPGRGLRRPRG